MHHKEVSLNIFISNSPHNIQPQALLSPTTLSKCNSMLTLEGWGSCLPPIPREHQHLSIAPELNWGTLPCPISPGTSSSAPWLHCWEQLPGPGELLKQLLSEVTTALGDTYSAPGGQEPAAGRAKEEQLSQPWPATMLSSSSWQPHQQDNSEARLKWGTESQKHNTHYYRVCFPPYFLIFTLTRASSLIITGHDPSVATSSAEAAQMIFTDEVGRSSSSQKKVPRRIHQVLFLPFMHTDLSNTRISTPLLVCMWKYHLFHHPKKLWPQVHWTSQVPKPLL